MGCAAPGGASHPYSHPLDPPLRESKWPGRVSGAAEEILCNLVSEIWLVTIFFSITDF